MKTLALTAICKNEEKHIERFLNSFMPYVDKVYLTDTGSTDKTLEIARRVGGDKIEIRRIEWESDFAKARNLSQFGIKEDYIIWADLDDHLKNPEAFMLWRQTMLSMSDMWLVTYNYALNPEGKSVCAFLRERVYRNDPEKFKWMHFIHEGIAMAPDSTPQVVHSWAIDHLRTTEDLMGDKGRNIAIFEKFISSGGVLDSRMKYYYGKEIYESCELVNSADPKVSPLVLEANANKRKQAIKWLLEANSQKDLELHDRTLCIQYACNCFMLEKKFMEAINMAHSGLLIAPGRAEFFVIIGDAYVQMGQLKHAIGWYEAAKSCEPNPNEATNPGFIYQHESAYKQYPRNALARIYAHIGQFEKAESESAKSFELYGDEESKMVSEECEKVLLRSKLHKLAIPTKDIVFSCLGSLYEWDEVVYGERGIGGSETACVEMAEWFKKLTGRRVIVFNPRAKPHISASGVEYLDTQSKMPEYFAHNKPDLHVAWRHNMKVTSAKTVLWSHDIITPEAEKSDQYVKYLTLSEFQKNLTKMHFNLPEAKLMVTRNGINPERFNGSLGLNKNPNKVIYVSSPDRGLERAIAVCEKAREKLPNLELHVFYGLDNMKKMGKLDHAKFYEDLMTARPWIKYHGNLKQDELVGHYKDASIWLYPTNFLETFCISALEVLLCGVYPVVRNYGALPDTLRGLPAKIVDSECVSQDEIFLWAGELVGAIDNKLWENIDEATHSQMLKTLSWESVAKEWIGEFLTDGSNVGCDDKRARAV